MFGLFHNGEVERAFCFQGKYGLSVYQDTDTDMTNRFIFFIVEVKTLQRPFHSFSGRKALKGLFNGVEYLL